MNKLVNLFYKKKMINNFSRILKFAWTDFTRNKGNNFAAVFILVIPILLATSLFIFQGVSKHVISEIEDKIDVTAYFRAEATEDEVLAVKNNLLNLSSEIKSVQYVSKDQALEEFLERHSDDPDFASALEEVGGNPFLSALNIKTEDPLQYEKLTAFLTSGPDSKYIEKVDYSQKRDTIDRVFNIISGVNRFGLVLSAILFLMAILVVLNTVKLSVDSSKEEITAMKLVGASNWFIRGPFVVQGAICGMIAFLICILTSGIAVYILSPKVAVIVGGFSLFHFFIANLGAILLIQLGFGVVLGALASFILVRSYLKV